METTIISSRNLKPVALTNGRSMTFTNGEEMFYASRRVANEILTAINANDHIDVWVQSAKRVEDPSFLRPYEKLNWLATPSRF